MHYRSVFQRAVHCTMLFGNSGRMMARFSLCTALFGFAVGILPVSVGYAQTSDAIATVATGSVISDTQESIDYGFELERIRVLVRANVLGLAEKLLVEQGPPLAPNKIWRTWQRQLWKVYAVQGKWQLLYDSASTIPDSFPLSIRKEAHLQSIDALLAMLQGQMARHVLRESLQSEQFDEVFKVELRQRLVESYLVDGSDVDAQIAMQQFQQDYRSQDPRWLMLSARVNLRLGKPDNAVNLLAPLLEPEAKLLRLYARLQNESLKPETVIDRVLAFREKHTDIELNRSSLALLIAAYRKADKLYPIVDVIEEYLSIERSGNTSLDAAFPAIELSDLPEAYKRVAEHQGNRFELLIGEDLNWLAHANNTKATATITRRSLFAYIASTATLDSIRQLARDAYVNILIDVDRTSLISKLFGKDKSFGELELSGAVGLRLSNFALEDGDIQLAADANENLLQLPPGMELQDWLLHSARLAIIAGRYAQGSDYLHQWINTFDTFEAEQTDQVLQPVFDLQTVAQHKLALPLLLKINKRSPSDRHRREIAYWIGESYFGTEDHLRAADYFLFSAMQENDGFDQWGESARFKAAESLMEANMIEDAKALFEDLLARAQEENRKIALQQKLQQLWLIESNQQSTQRVSNEINTN